MMLESATLTHRTRPALSMRPRNPNWLKVADAAALLDVDPSTLWRWKRAGLLTDVRTEVFGKTRYYWQPDIEALRDRLEAGPAEK